MKKVVQKYKFAVIASDVVIFTVKNGDLKVLLIKMKKAPFQKSWALPGGLVNGGESIDDSSARILKDKTGLANIYLEQLYTFGRVDRDPFGRVVSVAYYALMPSGQLELQRKDEHPSVEWFSVKKLPPLAYDHKEIIALAIQRLRDKLAYTNVVYSLLPKEFTLSELQAVYEVIMGYKIDKRNFRKKILATKILKKLPKLRRAGAHRPAELFQFKQRVLKVTTML